MHKVVLSLPILVKRESGNGNVDFWGEKNTVLMTIEPSKHYGDNQSARRKVSLSNKEKQQQIQPTYGVDARIWTQGTLVGGECSQQCTTISPQSFTPWTYHCVIFSPARCFCTIGLFSYKWLIEALDKHLQLYGVMTQTEVAFFKYQHL